MNGHLGPRRVPPADLARRVLLLYKPDQDWRCADNLTQMLRDRGAEVVTPSDPDLDPYNNLDAYYLNYLRQSAGVVVCWGDASEEWLEHVERKLSWLRRSDSQLHKLTRAKYFVEPPPKQRPQLRDEFIIRQEADLPPFLKAAGVGR